MSRIDFESITKSFGDQPAVRCLNLTMGEGAFTVILGPSGCGKTTALRMIAGLEEPDVGVLRLGGVVMNDPRSRVPPERRGVGLVFQSLALWPHFTVLGNLRFSAPRKTPRPRLLELLELVGLAGRAKAYPHELSGGERQRVAIARALAGEPKVLLLDEPLSDLDARLRVELSAALAEIQKRLGVTTVFVTHSQDEAFACADRLVIMRDGAVEQHDTPQRVYAQPRTAFVARFVGDAAVFPAGTFQDARWKPFLGAHKAKAAPCIVRPENVAPREGLEFTVTSCRYRGSHWLCAAEYDGTRVLFRSDHAAPVGTPVSLGLTADPVALADANADTNSDANADTGADNNTHA